MADGRALSVITAQDNERGDATSSVLELEIAADKMEAASQRQANPYRGVVNSRSRGAIEQSYLDPSLLQRRGVRNLIKDGETGKRQFTRIIVSQVHKDHHKKLIRREEIVNELIRLYQYYRQDDRDAAQPPQTNATCARTVGPAAAHTAVSFCCALCCCSNA